MYTQCNTEGNQYLLLNEIIDWQKDDFKAVKPEDKFVHSHNGSQHYWMMTKGWKLCVKWKDSTTSWEQLANLKESYPIKVAEFAVSRESTMKPLSHGGCRMYLQSTIESYLL
jgi:hypothetical protein